MKTSNGPSRSNAENEGLASSGPLSSRANPDTLEWTITTGCWRTRRKTFCYVTNPEGEVVFHARQFWPCVAFLDAIDVFAYIIRPDDEKDTGEPHIVVDRRKDAAWQR